MGKIKGKAIPSQSRGPVGKSTNWGKGQTSQPQSTIKGRQVCLTMLQKCSEGLGQQKVTREHTTGISSSKNMGLGLSGSPPQQ